MNIRRKTILIIVGLNLRMIAAMYITSNYVILSAFKNLEETNLHTKVNLAVNSLDLQIDGLDHMANDYASWDDTYMFIQDNNTAYIASNIVDETLRHSDIDLMAFINSSGQIICSRAYVVDNKTSIPFPAELKSAIASNNALWGFTDNRSYVKGVMNLGNNLIVVSSRPILTSQGKGPVRGAVLMGRYLVSNDFYETGALKLTDLQISVRGVLDKNMPSDFREALASLNNPSSFAINRFNETTVAGYAIENNVYESPGLVLRVAIPRSIYNEGLTTVRTYYLISILFSILIGIANSFSSISLLWGACPN